MDSFGSRKGFIVGLISLIGSLITIYVFVTGHASISQMFSSIETFFENRKEEEADDNTPSSDENDQPAEADVRHPYDRELLQRLGRCKDLLRLEFEPFIESSDIGQLEGSDPWFECQKKYADLLIENYKLSLARRDVERKAEHGFPPIAEEVFKDFQARQKLWGKYLKMYCEENVNIAGAQGSGAELYWETCIAEQTEERIRTISEMKEEVDRW